MEVEQVFPITTKVAGTNGDSAIATDNVIPSVSIEEEQHNDGAAATNEATTTTTVLNKEEMSMESTNGDDTMGPNTPISRSATPISRSASSHDRRQAKKRGAFSLFRAMFMSFSGNGSMKKRDATSEQKKAGDKPATAEASKDATWKNLVDGMRPLRLHGQLEYYPPPPPLGHDVYHDVLLPPPSPARSEGMTSRYASAQDLHQLDNGQDDEEERALTEGGDSVCSHAIDMQAEEFIAKFYVQFRLQKSESFNNRAE